MGRVYNISPQKFKDLTKSESHPNGLNHNDVASIIQNEHSLKYGKGKLSYNDEEKAIYNHPFTQKLIHLIDNTDIHPGDIFDYGKTVGRNFGVWQHPITGKEYPVIRDYGYTDSIAKEYQKRSRIIYDRNR